MEHQRSNAKVSAPSLSGTAKGDGAIVVSILMVSFNTRAMTLAALASLGRSHGPAMEIIVVDNASTDDSADAIAEAFPMVRLMRLGSNIGFARANNLAAKTARGAFLLLLNPDTVVAPDTVAHVIEFARRTPQAKIWGGRTLYPDGRLNPHSCSNRMTVWSILCRETGLSAARRGSAIFNPELIPQYRRDTVRAVDVVIGCFLLIERRFWDALNGFDPAFFLYGEEVDLCLRASRLGARPMITPDAVIVHYVGASQADHTNRTVQLLAARLGVIKRHFSPIPRYVATQIMHGGVIGRCLWFSALGLCGSRYADQKHRWRAVMQRRQEWWHGY